MTDFNSLGFIGAGNMGSAIIKGFSASGASENAKLYIYDNNPEKRASLKAEGYSVLNDENEVVQKCKFVVLACKPQQLPEILEKVKFSVNPETVLISLCAGISAEFIRKHTAESAKIVLVMPNMPMLLGAGATAMACGEAVTREEFAFARSVMESCGIVEVVPADKMNEIICINASSPAFIYLFAKCFADYAKEQGIDQKAALNLFSQTLIGSAKMMMKHEGDIQELIDQVTSKGGTTLAGLEKLHSGGLPEAVKSACEACAKRAYELGR